MKAKGITVCKGDDGVVRVYVLAGSKRDGGDAAAAVFSAVGAPLALSLVTFEVAGADVTSTASAAPPPAATQPAAQPVPPRRSAVVSQPSERVSSRDRQALAAVGMDMSAIMKVADRQRKKAVRVGVGVGVRVWHCSHHRYGLPNTRTPPVLRKGGKKLLRHALAAPWKARHRVRTTRRR